MWTEVRILFDAKAIPGGAEAILGSAECGPDVAEVEDIPVLKKVDVRVTLDAADPRLTALCHLLEEHGEEWLESREDRYSDEEIDQARLIVVESSDQVFGGPRVGTTYDMSEACPVCGTGARQTSAQIIDGDDLKILRKLRAASTYYNDMLVDEELAEEMEGAGITGLSLRDVETATKVLPFRQLCARRTLPPVSPRSTGVFRDVLCHRCGRGGFTTHRDTPMRLVYRARDLEQAEDVNLTWEWFGEWRFDGDVSKALFSYPFLLVTPKVWRFFRDAGVTGYHYMPIRVEQAGE